MSDFETVTDLATFLQAVADDTDFAGVHGICEGIDNNGNIEWNDDAVLALLRVAASRIELLEANAPSTPEHPR